MSDTATEDSEKDASRRIEFGGETYMPDSEYCATKLNVTQRTGSKYDREGQPYVMIGGEKWRPLNACAEFWASRIVRKQPKRVALKYSARVAI
jgi:hypothetical protein